MKDVQVVIVLFSVQTFTRNQMRSVQVEVKRKKIERKNNNFTDGFTCNIFWFFRIGWKMMKGTYENTLKNIYVYTI